MAEVRSASRFMPPAYRARRRRVRPLVPASRRSSPSATGRRAATRSMRLETGLSHPSVESSMRSRLTLALGCALLLFAPAARAQAPAFQFAFGTQGFLPGQFQLPHGLAVAADGTIYVGDTLNGRVQAFSPTGLWQRQWSAGTPGGVAIDGSGNVLVLDVNTDRVLRFSVFGALLGSFGGTGSANGQLNFPLDIAVD